jgi:hypothetical protein
VRSAVAAVAYGALTLWSAFWAAVGGVVGCYEDCPNEGEWWDRSDAWQWDAIALLGLVSAVVGLAALASMFWRWRVGAALVVGHLAVLAVAGGLMGQNPDLGSRPVVVSYVLVVAAAAALVQLRRPSRGDARGNRGGPSA